MGADVEVEVRMMSRTLARLQRPAVRERQRDMAASQKIRVRNLLGVRDMPGAIHGPLPTILVAEVKHFKSQWAREAIDSSALLLRECQ